MRASTVRVSRGANLLRKFVIYTIFGINLPQITKLRNPVINYESWFNLATEVAIGGSLGGTWIEAGN